MSTITTLKEQALAQTPVLLFDFTFRDGSTRRFATHGIEFGGVAYEARVLGHNIFEIQAMNEEGIDQIPSIQLVLANANATMSQIQSTKDFKGAVLSVRFAFTASPGSGLTESTDAITVFTGVCNAPEEINDLELHVTAVNRMNMQRVSIPVANIQKRCFNPFPMTAEQRIAACTDRNSIFWACGFSPDVVHAEARGNAGGIGSPCARTRQACQAKGMFQTDDSARVTARFSGIEFLPQAIPVRPYGQGWQQSPVMGATHGDKVPMVWGQGWVRAPMTALRNDGNLSRLECVLSLGEIEEVLQVVVNGVTIPKGIAGVDMTSSGWYNLVNWGERTGDFDLMFGPAGTSDPYGSMAYLSVVVPTKLSDGRSAPDIRVLLKGRKVETFDASGSSLGWSWSQNPVWVLLDVLKLARWNTADLAMPTWYDAAAYCDEVISQTDDDGNTVNLPRFRTNLVIENRMSAAEVVLGIRNAARLYFTYDNAGKLECRVEKTIAEQQSEKPYGSNATSLINGGWPAYVYSDTTATILRQDDGASSLRVISRPISETPTRVRFEFQNEFNLYSQDSVELIDTDEQNAVGQDVSALMPVLGCPNYHQALRIANLQISKSVYGNEFVEFETSVKGVGQQVGQIIALSYAKEGFVDRLYRILKVSPQENFRTMRILAQYHDDIWYTDSSDAPPRRRPRHGGSLNRPPMPVSGGLAETGVASTLAMMDIRETYYQLAEAVTRGADGTPRLRLKTTGYGSAQMLSVYAEAPQLDLQPTVETTGGSLPGGTAFFYAIAAVDDADGRFTRSSWVATAEIPEGTNANRVILTGLRFDPRSAEMVVYRGRTPGTMIAIYRGAVASSFTDTGAGFENYVPYDELLDRIVLRWRAVKGLRVAPTPATSSGSAWVANSEATWATDAHVGAVLEIVRGTGQGQRRVITSNTATQLNFADALITDDTSVFVIHANATAATATSITDTGLDLADYTGEIVRITSGKGAYQERRIASNTPTSITITEAWDVIPDATSSFLVVDDAWSEPLGTSKIENSPARTAFYPAAYVPNIADYLIELVMLGMDAHGNEAIYANSPMVRYAVEGAVQSPIVEDEDGTPVELVVDPDGNTGWRDPSGTVRGGGSLIEELFEWNGTDLTQFTKIEVGTGGTNYYSETFTGTQGALSGNYVTPYYRWESAGAIPNNPHRLMILTSDAFAPTADKDLVIEADAFWTNDFNNMHGLTFASDVSNFYFLNRNSSDAYRAGKVIAGTMYWQSDDMWSPMGRGGYRTGWKLRFRMVINNAGWMRVYVGSHMICRLPMTRGASQGVFESSVITTGKVGFCYRFNGYDLGMNALRVYRVATAKDWMW